MARDIYARAVMDFLSTPNANGELPAHSLKDEGLNSMNINRGGLTGLLVLTESGIELVDLKSTVRGTRAYRLVLDACEAFYSHIIIWSPDDDLQHHLLFRGYEPMMGFRFGFKSKGMEWRRQ